MAMDFRSVVGWVRRKICKFADFVHSRVENACGKLWLKRLLFSFSLAHKFTFNRVDICNFSKANNSDDREQKKRELKWERTKTGWMYGRSIKLCVVYALDNTI